MTIKQLKKILDKYDEKLEVLVKGYEGGVSSLRESSVGEIKFNKNINKEWYYGEHEQNSRGKFKGILLSR